MCENINDRRTMTNPDSISHKKFGSYKFKYDSGVIGIVNKCELHKWTFIYCHKWAGNDYLIFIPNSINESKHTNITINNDYNKWTCDHRIGKTLDGHKLYDVKYCAGKWSGTIRVNGIRVRTSKNYKFEFDKLSYPKLTHKTKRETIIYKWYENNQLSDCKTFNHKTKVWEHKTWSRAGTLKSVRYYKIKKLVYPSGLEDTYHEYIV